MECYERLHHFYWHWRLKSPDSPMRIEIARVLHEKNIVLGNEAWGDIERKMENLRSQHHRDMKKYLNRPRDTMDGEKLTLIGGGLLDIVLE